MNDGRSHPLDEEALRHNGFAGFTTFSELFGKSVRPPAEPGIYVVLNGHSKIPEFLSISTGGHFKSKDPSVPVSFLLQKWIDAPLLYLGMAKSLRQRLGQFARFGAGKPVGHWGGRYIWQLPDAMSLKVSWKPMIKPREEESRLLQQFIGRYGTLPFANLVL